MLQPDDCFSLRKPHTNMEQDIPTELTQSMWADVLKQVGGDKEKAKGLFKGMEEQENEKAKERKVRELEANFPDTPKELIVKVLAENNWDVELAILPLFERVEQQRQAEKEHERQEQAKKREAERKARKQQASEQAQSFLQNLFANIPGEKIQALLDQNEGDVDATTEQLLALVPSFLPPPPPPPPPSQTTLLLCWNFLLTWAYPCNLRLRMRKRIKLKRERKKKKQKY